MVVVIASSLLEGLSVVEQQQHQRLHYEVFQNEDYAHSSQPKSQMSYQYHW